MIMERKKKRFLKEKNYINLMKSRRRRRTLITIQSQLNPEQREIHF